MANKAFASQSSMRVSMFVRQRGVGLIGLLVLGVVGLVLVLLGSEIVPSWTEYSSIQQAVKRAAQSGSNPAEIRGAFERARTANYIQSISGDDLKITKAGDRYIVEFAYQKEIHLVGPAYLTFKYRGRSE